MIDLEEARRLANVAFEATTKPDDAAKNWATLRALSPIVQEMAKEIEGLREQADRALLDGASQMRSRAAAVVQRARERGETDHRAMRGGIQCLALVLNPGETDFDPDDDT